MARILVLHVVDLEPVRRDVSAGLVPDQLLYGVNHFERRGHSVEIVPFQRSALLKGISGLLRRAPLPLGDFDQQMTVLREAQGADLVYCPSQMVAQLLAYLRFAGRLPCPMVWMVHHPLDRGRLRRWRRPAMRALLRGVDAYPALTSFVARDLATVAGTADRTTGLKWGPDPEWYPIGAGVGRGVIAAGWSRRDFETFTRAANQTSVPTRIVCTHHHLPSTPTAANTQLINTSIRPITHRQLTDLYAEARALAVPLRVQWPWNLNGLTSITDALGMGKPVIVTRNPWIDLDVEERGIGLWVSPGDVDGWRQAIEYLDEHPALAKEMGRRARALVDSGEYSSHTFAGRLMDIFERVLDPPALR